MKKRDAQQIPSTSTVKNAPSSIASDVVHVSDPERIGCESEVAEAFSKGTIEFRRNKVRNGKSEFIPGHVDRK